ARSDRAPGRMSRTLRLRRASRETNMTLLSRLRETNTVARPEKSRQALSAWAGRVRGWLLAALVARGSASRRWLRDGGVRGLKGLLLVALVALAWHPTC